MRFTKNKRYLFALLFSAIFTNIFGQNNCDFTPRKTEILITNSIGYGANKSEATKDAKRNAITEAVGSYIQTETTISNDKIDQDKIYEYGKGLIQQFCILTEVKQKRGYEITIKAVVAKEKILETLYASGIEVTFLGEKLSQTMFSELDRIDSESEQVDLILTKLEAGDPFIYTIKELGVREKHTMVGTQAKLDRDNKTLKIAIAVKPNYKNYLRNLENALKNVADISITDDMILSIGKNEMIYFPFSHNSDKISSEWTGTNKLMFINEIHETFPSNSLTSIFKSKNRKRFKKENFLKKYKGLNYHINASLVSFYDPSIYQTIKKKIQSHLSSDEFIISFINDKGAKVISDISGEYNNMDGNIKISSVVSTKKGIQKNNSNSVSFLSTEYTNYKKEQLNSLIRKSNSTDNKIQYLTNDEGSFNKERLYSTAGFALSFLPFIDASIKRNAWNNSGIEAHGFSSEYNPHSKYYNSSTWAAGISGAAFGLWRYSLKYFPRKILKTSESETITIFCSDTDYLTNTVNLNAQKLGKINKTHEIYNWDIFDEPNNTIAVFYIEVPIKLEQLGQISKIKIK